MTVLLLFWKKKCEKMNTITFRLPTQQKSQLISIAKERNVTVSALLRQILRPYADAQEQGNGVDKTSVSRLLLSTYSQT